jgi:hypothetical protein
MKLLLKVGILPFALILASQVLPAAAQLRIEPRQITLLVDGKATFTVTAPTHFQLDHRGSSCFAERIVTGNTIANSPHKATIEVRALKSGRCHIVFSRERSAQRLPAETAVVAITVTK